LAALLPLAVDVLSVLLPQPASASAATDIAAATLIPCTRISLSEYTHNPNLS
jgi:hypothetical protein